jgi:GH24 family phage-related lysozyme (muramidase)
VNQALELIEQDIAKRVNWALDKIQVPLSQNQVNALGDFIFNAGGGTFERTILPYLNAGYYDVVPDIIGRVANPSNLPGITARRVYEAQMFQAQ